jgi:hypothetical protein
LYDPSKERILFSKRVCFHEDQFSRDYEDLTYNDDQVSKKDNKVRDDEYQPSENDDEMCEVDMLLSEAPKDYYEASQSEDWVSSKNREIQSFKDMKVYEICPREESRGKIIQSRWVYAVKTDPTAAEKEKSRIVVKGFTQLLY